MSCEARGMVCACQDLPTTTGLESPGSAEGPVRLSGGVHGSARVPVFYVFALSGMGLWQCTGTELNLV